RVLGVRTDVEVETGAVRQEDVGGPPPFDDGAEQVACHLLGPQPAGLPRRVRDPVFGLQAVDAGHASPSSLRNVRWVSTVRSRIAASTCAPRASVSPMASRPTRIAS